MWELGRGVLFELTCSQCGKVYDLQEPGRMVCDGCSAQQGADEPLRGLLVTRLEGRLTEEGWRISDLLPVDPLYLPHIPVGNTPLWRLSRLGRQLGLAHLYAKNDGANPTGSFKDRASWLVAARALAMGAREVVLASTGNAGSSMAGIGAACGLAVTLFLPKTAPKAKIVQAMQYGARTILVDGNYDKAYDMSLAYSRMHGVMNRSTGYNPFTTEGKKSVSLELLRDLGSLPDVIFVPVGDGCILAGVYKGLEDLRDLGLVRKIPHVVGVQAEGSAALASFMEKGGDIGFFTKVASVTVADSIGVDVPRAGYLAAKYLKAHHGRMVVVTDQEILEAQKLVASQEGLFVEPAAATAFAGVLQRRAELGRDAKIVVLATGTGLKDTDAAMRLAGPLPRPIATLHELDLVQR